MLRQGLWFAATNARLAGLKTSHDSPMSAYLDVGALRHLVGSEDVNSGPHV